MKQFFTWICCPQHCYSFLSYCLFPLGYSAVHLHWAIFMFFFCFCMSYAKIELFTQWNKNILNDFRPVFSVDVILNVKEEDMTSDAHFLPLHKTLHQAIYIYILEVPTMFACMPAIGDMLWVDVPGTGWGRVSCVERRQSGLEHTRQVCAAYVVTWRLEGRLGPKQMKHCLMAAFIKFTKRGGRGWTEEKQVAGPVHSEMKTDIVQWSLKRVAIVEGFMKTWPPWTRRLPVMESCGIIAGEEEMKEIGEKNVPAKKPQSVIIYDEIKLSQYLGRQTVIVALLMVLL